MQKLADAEGAGLPFGLYLLAASLVAIATVGNTAFPEVVSATVLCTS